MNWKKKLAAWVEDEQVGEWLFFLAFAVYLGLWVWLTTLYPLSSLASKICKLLFIGLIGLRILVYCRYRVRTLLLLGFALACSVITWKQSGYVDPFLWVLLIAGSQDIPFKKILQIYLTVGASIIILAFAGSMRGVIENLQYTSEGRGIRNSFGVNYPTDFAAHIFFLLLSFFYLKGAELKRHHYIIGLAVGVVVYIFCNARVDSACIFLTVALFGVGNQIKNSKQVGKRIQRMWRYMWMHLGTYIMPALLIFSIVLYYFYDSSAAFWKVLDSTLEARLAFGKQGFEDFGVKLFGQKIDMIGNGGTTKYQGEYFFLDCSYVNILLTWGLILFCIVIGIHIYICNKNKQDEYFLYAIAIIAINCVIAQHLMEIGYNPFPLALLTLPVRFSDKRSGPQRGNNSMNSGGENHAGTSEEDSN